MTLNQIFAERSRTGSQIVIDIETHCGFEASRSELRRLVNAVAHLDDTDAPGEFQRLWENDSFWTDEATA